MDSGLENLEPLLSRLDGLLSSAAPSLPAPRRTAIERWRADSDALRFHLRHFSSRDDRRASDAPPLVAVIGGTGTGKSTLVNRLIGRTFTAASFRRTFTSGAIALARRASDVPSGWLNLGHVVAAPNEIPARGREGVLVVVELGSVEGRETSLVAAAAEGGNARRSGGDQKPSTDAGRPSFDAAAALPTLVDTPDLDGDTPSHHAQADRVFRWAQGVAFAVTPEKYQMTELWPYYRLARRYAVPAVFIMNKCEEQAVAEDFVRQLWTRVYSSPHPPLSPSPTLAAEKERGRGEEGERGREVPQVFVIPRDDSGYEPPPEMGLEAMRAAVASLPQPSAEEARRGLHRRAADLEGRFNDQVLGPLRQDRREADRLIAALRSMEAPPVGVDVNPLTQQLQRRLQQRSVLYLMGPQRVLERVRQAPTLIARLPRVAWDYLRTGSVSAESFNPTDGKNAETVPDFKAILADQFAVLQSRIDDVLRSSPVAEKWITGGEGEGGPAASGATTSGAAGGRSYASVRLPPSEAGRIAEEELAELRAWLERRWNATPRDTRAVEALLKKLPGGKKASRWTEAAPYLLAIGLASTSVMFGHIDLIILGGYGVVTWLGEKIANEVGAQTRATNAKIEQRYADLAHDQLNRVCDWLDRQAPGRKLLEQLERAGAQMTEAVGG